MILRGVVLQQIGDNAIHRIVMKKLKMESLFRLPIRI